MNKKIIFISYILISIVIGCEQSNSCTCHPSCICDKGSSVCSQCKLSSIGSKIDDYKMSCPCPLGYYTSQQDPFQCTKLTSQNKNDACVKEIQIKAQDISLTNNYSFGFIDGVSYVISEVSLKFSAISIINDCKKLYVHKIQYLKPETLTYVDLNSKYFTNGENGSVKIKIPFLDVYSLSSVINVGDQQISQQIDFFSQIGTSDKYVKQIKWSICIYTNRSDVQVFQIDGDIQNTTEDCTDCIVVADLDTIGKVYTSNTFSTLKSAPYVYKMGDYFYAKITFVDASYTKYLKFLSLLYKNDLGQIYDYSSITAHQWQNNGLTIALPLSEPSDPATIQVTMSVEVNSGGRFLQNTEEEKIKNNFSFIVQSVNQGLDHSNIGDSTFSYIKLFNLINFISILLFL